MSGITAGGIFPIALAVVGDRISVAQRQVAIGRLLFAAMTGNLLGASGAGVIGDLVGWRGVFITTGMIDLIALAMAIPGFRGMNEQPGRFDLSTLIPNYRAVLSNPLAKYCFGAVFIEAVFMFGVFPYMAVMLRAGGETRASIAGLVLAGFGIGGVIYTIMVSRLLSFIGERRLMASGGMVMAFCLIVIALRMPWPVEFLNFILLGLRLLLPARLRSGLRHRVGAGCTRLGDRGAIRSSFLSGRRWGRWSMASAYRAASALRRCWSSAPLC